MKKHRSNVNKVVVKEIEPQIVADHVSIMEDKKALLVKDVFYRPHHPDFAEDKPCGWIASWQLEYKYSTYKKGVLCRIEECFTTEEAAKEALPIYQRKHLKERSNLQYI